MDMAIPEVRPTISYDGNGSTVTPYPIPWLFLDSSHVEMYIDGVLDTTDGFVAAGQGNDAGGTITTNVAYDSSKRVTFLRTTPYNQLTDLEDGGRIPAEILEDAYDYVVMQIQQLLEKLDRAFLAPPGQTLNELGWIRYDAAQTLTVSQRAQASRNEHAWHWHGIFDAASATVTADVIASGPFKVGQIIMFDTINHPAGTPCNVTDELGRVQSLFGTGAFISMKDDTEFNFLNFFPLLPAQSLGDLQATGVPWPVVDPLPYVPPPPP